MYGECSASLKCKRMVLICHITLCMYLYNNRMASSCNCNLFLDSMSGFYKPECLCECSCDQKGRNNTSEELDFILWTVNLQLLAERFLFTHYRRYSIKYWPFTASLLMNPLDSSFSSAAMAYTFSWQSQHM